MENELKHHGIMGQKWGKRNGPPYPLDESDHSALEKKLARGEKLASKIKRIEDKNETRNQNGLSAKARDKYAQKLSKIAGRTDMDEARGQAQLRRANIRRQLTMDGVIVRRSYMQKLYLDSLSNDERGQLLKEVGKMVRPRDAATVVRLYAKIDMQARKMSPADRDAFFDEVLKKLK